MEAREDHSTAIGRLAAKRRRALALEGGHGRV